MGMTYAKVGRSGLKVSRVGLGSWLTYGSSVDMSTAARCVETALDAGVVFVDTANIEFGREVRVRPRWLAEEVEVGSDR